MKRRCTSFFVFRLIHSFFLNVHFHIYLFSATPHRYTLSKGSFHASISILQSPWFYGTAWFPLRKPENTMSILISCNVLNLPGQSIWWLTSRCVIVMPEENARDSTVFVAQIYHEHRVLSSPPDECELNAIHKIQVRHSLQARTDIIHFYQYRCP